MVLRGAERDDMTMTAGRIDILTVVLASRARHDEVL